MNNNSFHLPGTVPLTDIQRQALDTDHTILVRAGAGSGKTTLLVQRFIKLMQEKPELDINQILAITFTRKAAAEMRERIRKYLSSDEFNQQINANPSQTEWTSLRNRILYQLNRARISTIHAFCRELIRQFPLECNVAPGFEVLEDDLEKVILSSAISQTINACAKDKNNDLKILLSEFSPQQITEKLSTLFQNRESYHIWYQKYAVSDSNELINCLSRLWIRSQTTYEKIKQESAKLDNTDLIHIAHAALQNHAQIRQFYQSKFHYILVDEFQDTDHNQWEIIQNICSGTDYQNSKKLFVVGDEKQSIYAFRGTDAALFLATQNEMESNPQSRIINANENFRSDPNIIEFINGIFEQLFQSSIDYIPIISKKNNPLTPIEAVDWGLINNNTANANEFATKEAELICDWIIHQINTIPSAQYNDFAILFRHQTHIDIFKQCLTQKNIPHIIEKGNAFYQQEEIRDLWILIRALVNPTDNIYWLGVLKSPIFGISETAINGLYTILSGHQNIIDKLNAFQNLSKKDKQKIYLNKSDQIILETAFQKITHWLTQINLIPPKELIEDILTSTGAWAIYAAPPNGQQRIANIQKLIQKIGSITQNTYASWFEIDAILSEHIQTNKEAQANITSTDHAVTIMTIHKAKGLEFPYVIIPELHKKLISNKGIAFHPKLGISISKKDERHKEIKAEIFSQLMEEEKRIFYVACTRAKSKLFLTGQLKDPPTKKTAPKEPTKPESYLEMLTQWTKIQIKSNQVQCTFRSKTITYPQWSPSESINAAIQKPTHQKHVPRETFSLNQFNANKNITHISAAELINEFQRSSPKIQTRKTSSSASSQEEQNIGIFVHAGIEIINQWQKDAHFSSDNLIRSIPFPQNITLSEPAMNTVITHLQNYINSPISNEIKDAMFAFHEEPFTLKIQNTLIQGRLDTIIKTKTGFKIIDYKTTSAPIKKITQGHPFWHQMHIYAVAAKYMFGIKTEPISSHIFFTKNKTEIQIPLPPQNIDATEQQIADYAQKARGRQAF